MKVRWILIGATLLFSLGPSAWAADYSMDVSVPASVEREGQFTALLRGSSVKALIGFAALLRYDTAALALSSTSFAGTVWETSDYLSVLDLGAGTLRIGVVHDQDGLAPPASVSVPAGSNLAFLNLVLNARSCPGSAAIGFTGGIDDNLLADVDLKGHDSGNGLVLTAGSTTVVTAGTFIRGNARGDPVSILNPGQSVNIADAIFLLNFLFKGETAPPCLDAADANDDGRLNLLDPIWVFQFLIGNVKVGPQLPPPFAKLGKDPTSDSLDCATPPASSGCP